MKDEGCRKRGKGKREAGCCGRKSQSACLHPLSLPGSEISRVVTVTADAILNRDLCVQTLNAITQTASERRREGGKSWRGIKRIPSNEKEQTRDRREGKGKNRCALCERERETLLSQHSSPTPTHQGSLTLPPRLMYPLTLTLPRSLDLSHHLHACLSASDCNGERVCGRRVERRKSPAAL